MNEGGNKQQIWNGEGAPSPDYDTVVVYVFVRDYVNVYVFLVRTAFSIVHYCTVPVPALCTEIRIKLYSNLRTMPLVTKGNALSLFLRFSWYCLACMYSRVHSVPSIYVPYIQ